MIRIASETDLPAILDIYGPYIITTTSTFEYRIPSREEFALRFREYTGQFPWLVWEEDGTVLGYAYAGAPWERAAYRWCAEPSIYLMPEARGKGIGRKLYEALEQILTEQGYRLSYAIITSENEASLAFHQKMGYTETARFPGCGYKFGRQLGVTWMEKSLVSVDTPRKEPVPFPVFVENGRKFLMNLGILSLS
mgnify:CR=1 FL=1